MYDETCGTSIDTKLDFPVAITSTAAQISDGKVLEMHLRLQVCIQYMWLKLTFSVLIIIIKQIVDDLCVQPINYLLRR